MRILVTLKFSKRVNHLRLPQNGMLTIMFRIKKIIGASAHVHTLVPLGTLLFLVIFNHGNPQKKAKKKSPPAPSYKEVPYGPLCQWFTWPSLAEISITHGL